MMEIEGRTTFVFVRVHNTHLPLPCSPHDFFLTNRVFSLFGTNFYD